MLPPSSRPSSGHRAVALAALLVLLQPRTGRAENFATYKYEDYSESGGRIGVTTQSALLQQGFGGNMQVKVMGVIDAIAGATPNGQPAPAGSDQVVLADMHDRRKAWNADLSRDFTAGNLDVGVANSRENDYVSKGWSVNARTELNEKNTTLVAGIAGTSDRIKVFYQPSWANKRNVDLLAGVSQLLDPQTVVTVNVSWGRATGYLSDPYKLVQKRIEVVPGIFLPFTFGENRPDARTRWSVLGSVNHAFPGLKAAVEGSYRFYHDTFGTDAHTVEVAWLQRLGSQVIVEPTLRYYDQTAASFYHYNLDDTGITPVSGTPNPHGPFFSSDYRLSALRAMTLGLKVTWQVSPKWRVNAGLENYRMRGKDGKTAGSAYPTAHILTAGVSFNW